jgi:glycosyltransferase involved in cell wall biosynthesis
MMRIVIDLQGAQTESRFRGIGRYSLSLSKAIIKNIGNHEVIIALNGMFPETIKPIRDAFRGLLPQENIKVWLAPGPVMAIEVDNATRNEVAILIREAFIESLHPDIVLLTTFFEGFTSDAVVSVPSTVSFKTIPILYDLIPLRNKDKYLQYEAFKNFYLDMIDKFKKSDAFVAISESSAAEARELLNIPDNIIINISTACDKVFRKIEISNKDNLIRFGINKKYVLYTGGADDRKNLERLICAYSSLPRSIREDHQLVLVGKIHENEKNNLINYAAKCGLKKDEMILTGYVSDDEMVYLYNACSLFVFPSWHEGFGLPPLEAINCGAPVIGSNCSSIPEVIGCYDALFDPYNVNEIAKKIEMGLTDKDFISFILNEEAKQIPKFSWDITANHALSYFETLLANNCCNSTKLNTNNSYSVKDLIAKISLVDSITEYTDSDIQEIAKAIDYNLKQPSEKLLFVDISQLVTVDSKSGVQRVVRSVLKELLNDLSTGLKVIPVYSKVGEYGYRYADVFFEEFMGICSKKELKDDYIEFKPGDIFLGLDLQHHVVNYQYEYLKRINLLGVRIFFVVYDLLPILLTQHFPPHYFLKDAHINWLSVVTNFDGAVCISKAVADELTNWMSTNVPDRMDKFEIKWFHLGADIDNSIPTLGIPEGADHILSQISSNKSFIMVGTIEPRKRQDLVLEAFECLWNEGISTNLVIVGKKGWLTDDLCDRIRKHREYGKRLFWLEGISDEYLEKVYAASTCLIAASEGEGFGLPLIEAAQKKIPIIARDIPVFREVAGKHAFYFSATTGDELADSIKEWLTLYNEDRHPKSDDMPWLTWKESTKQLLKAIGIESERSGSDDE